MALGDAAVQNRRIESDAVVGDPQDGRVQFPVQGDVESAGTGMFVCVVQKLPDRAVDQRLRLRAAHFVDFSAHRRPPTLLVALGQFAHRRAQSDLFQDLRIEGADSIPQRRDGLPQRGVEPIEVCGGGAFPQLIEIQSCGQQILQRTVMQLLGQFPVAALIGAHRLRHQPSPHIEQCPHPIMTARQRERHRRDGGGEPQQAAHLGIDQGRNTVTHLLVLGRIDRPGQ
jgi:hypothetical protein